MAKILIVEDDALVRRMLCETLRDCGHEVQSASDGDEGIAMIRNQSFDLVITDMLMKTSGLELLNAVMNPAIAGETPFKLIAISGGGDLDPAHYLRTAEVLGAHRTLAKPIPRELLLQTIDELLAE